MTSVRALLERFAHDPLVRAAGLIVAVVLAANALTLTGIVDVNPTDTRAALSTRPRESWLPGEYTIDPNDGFTADALGHAAAESWLSGHVPYWNSNEGLGTPLAGEMQAGAFSPFVLLLHFYDGLLYLHVVLEVLAGIATMYFLSQLGLRRGAATLGGILFALNGTHAWLTNAAFAPIAFLPVILIGAERCIDRVRVGRAGGYGWVVAGVSLSLLAGFPEVAYLDALVVVVWCLVRLLELKGIDKVALLRKLIAGVVLGVMIAAPALVAFVDFVAQADVGPHSNAIASAHLDSDFLFSLVLPYATGAISGTATAAAAGFWGGVGGYLGMSVIVLALYGAFDRRWRTAQIVIGGFAVLLVMRIFGLLSVVITLSNLIPGARYTVFFRYSAPALEFILVVLAAFGADRLLRGERNRRHTALVAVGAMLILGAAAVQARRRVAENPATDFRLVLAIGSVLVGLSVVCGILVCASLPTRSRWASRLACGIAIVEAVVLFALPQLSARHNDPAVDRTPIQFLSDHLGTARIFSLGPISPNYGSAFGIAQINVNDSPLPKPWGTYLSTQLNSNAIPSVFTGYSPADPAGPDAFTEFQNHLTAYEAAGVRYLVTFQGAISSEVAAQLSLVRVFSSPGADILETSDPAPYFAAAGCTVTIEDRTHAGLDCARASMLTRLEMPMLGWSAEVNGRDTAVSAVNDVFQAVAVPAGLSTIVFAFEPPHIRLAWASVLLALIILAMRGMLGRRRRGNQPVSPSASVSSAAE